MWRAATLTIENLKIQFNLCVCNRATSASKKAILKFVQKQFRNVQCLKEDLVNFISGKKQEICFIFLKTIPNLSLYRSDRYDKNLSLNFICGYEYINVSINALKYATGIWLPNSCINAQFGYQTCKFGYQIIARDPAGDPYNE